MEIKECYIVKKRGATNPVAITSTKKEAQIEKVRFLRYQRKIGARPKDKDWIITKALDAKCKR